MDTGRKLKAASPRPATHISDASWWNRPGAIDTGPELEKSWRKRQQGIPAEIVEIAWKAQNRLHKRYTKLTLAGKDQRKVMVAVGRELLGFIWAIAIKAERIATQPVAA